MKRIDLEDRLIEFADKHPKVGVVVGISYFVSLLGYNIFRDYLVGKFRREEKRAEHPDFKDGPPYKDL